MAANFKIGQTVSVVTVVPKGPVKALTVNQDGDIQYLVEYKDVDGSAQERWFKEDEIALAE